MTPTERGRKLSHKLLFKESGRSGAALPAPVQAEDGKKQPAHTLKASRTSAAPHNQTLLASRSRLREDREDELADEDAAACSASHRRQKRAVKQQYVTARTEEPPERLTLHHALRKTKQAVRNGGRKAVRFVVQHKGLLIAAGAAAGALLFLTGVFSSISLLFQGTGAGIGLGTYPSAEEDMLAAEHEYCAREEDLLHEMEHYDERHPEYDDVDLDLDELWHDPYVLISALHALHGGPWTIEEIQPELEHLFSQQYIVTAEETSNENSEAEDTLLTCTVTLENRNLARLPVYTMSEEQMSAYSMYMASLGNRPDLFPSSEYVTKYFGTDPLCYEIPPEALEDEDFAAMVREAEKYLGFPYVWGGSSPSTSFDCSGFVSWVLDQCGWKVGRMGCIGLLNYCTLVPSENAKPGDLIFFLHTYDAPEPDLPTHVGIYVGGGMMIHCGDPISYASVEDAYWQSHFYAFGRLPKK